MTLKTEEKLGDLLVKAGLIDELQLQSALGHQKRWGGKIGKVLVDLGFVEESELLKFLSEHFHVKAVDLARSRITSSTFESVPKAIAKKYGVVPVFIKEQGGKKTIVLAMSDPTDMKVIDEIQFLTGNRVEPVLATDTAILKVLDHYGDYTPEESPHLQSARPVDLRREEQKKKETESETKEEQKPMDKEILLGGEKSPFQEQAVLELKEAILEEEGIEIEPGDEFEVIKGEVTILKTPDKKSRPSTERVPQRPTIHDKLENIDEIDTLVPGRQKKYPEDDTKILGSPVEQKKEESQFQKPTNRPVEAIEIPEPAEEEKLELADAHEFIPQYKPELADQQGVDEQFATDSMHPEAWKIKERGFDEAGIATQEQKQEMEEAKSPLSAESLEEALWEKPVASVNELGIKHDAESSGISEEDQNSAMEIRLPFEKPITPPPYPEVSKRVQKLEEEPVLEKLKEPLEKQELYEAEVGEKTSKRAEEQIQTLFERLAELEIELRQQEFQFNNLLDLVLKNELGEISKEIFKKELILLKKHIEDRKKIR